MNLSETIRGDFVIGRRGLRSRAWGGYLSPSVEVPAMDFKRCSAIVITNYIMKDSIRRRLESYVSGCKCSRRALSTSCRGLLTEKVGDDSRGVVESSQKSRRDQGNFPGLPRCQLDALRIVD